MALDDDPVMTGILDAGCDYLVALANVLQRQLGAAQLGTAQLGTAQLGTAQLGTAQLGTGQSDGELPVAMHGGVFGNPYVRGRFVSATGAEVAARPPEVGAVDLAMRYHRRSDHGTARRIQ